MLGQGLQIGFFVYRQLDPDATVPAGILNGIHQLYASQAAGAADKQRLLTQNGSCEIVDDAGVLRILTVAQVAERTGFQDANYFCRVFKNVLPIHPPATENAWEADRCHEIIIFVANIVNNAWKSEFSYYIILMIIWKKCRHLLAGAF